MCSVRTVVYVRLLRACRAGVGSALFVVSRRNIPLRISTARGELPHDERAQRGAFSIPSTVCGHSSAGSYGRSRGLQA